MSHEIPTVYQVFYVTVSYLLLVLSKYQDIQGNLMALSVSMYAYPVNKFTN